MRSAILAHAASAASREAVLSIGLQAMGKLIEQEIGLDVSFALFVEWKDGQPMSYVSNIPRPRVVPIFEEWLPKAVKPAARSVGPAAPAPQEAPVLEAKCAALGKELASEDIDVVLFLITWGEDGEVAWFSSMERAYDVVSNWVKYERAARS